jgi:hypothetical protein
MFHDPEITDRIRAIGACQVLAARLFFDASFSEDDAEAEAAEREVMELAFGAGIVAESLGLNVRSSDVLLILDDPQQISHYLLHRVAFDRRLPDMLREHLGDDAAFQLDFTRAAGAIQVLASFVAGALPLARKAGIDKSAVIRERDSAIQGFGHYAGLFRGVWHDRLHTNGDVELANIATDLAIALSPGRWTVGAFERVQTVAGRALAQLIPHFPLIDERLLRARAIIRELKSCAPGRSDWRRYEDVCIRALRLLFMPPFRTISVQRRTVAGHERRDAILTNNQFGGFWSLVRQDLDCRHVVCEFKNVQRLGKSDVNQIRIYLRKPTIGRFGLIFHRRRAGQSARMARHIAYADDRALILLIDDVALVRLLLTRAFLGSADVALENMKVEFETTY